MLFAMGRVHSLSGLRKSSTFILLVLLSILLASQPTTLAQSASTGTGNGDCPPPDAILITEYPIPTSGTELSGITAGPDGALWFGEDIGAIGRITLEGEITEYPLQDTHSALPFVVAGPDGAVWFTDITANLIGQITLEGDITSYAIPSDASRPAGIAVGADQAIWFTENAMHQIGRITMEGEFTEYPTPTANSGPLGITLGSDGAIWFTERSASQIGRITTDGEITEYPVPTPDSLLLRITAGSDGALWFTEFDGNQIGRITTDGEITEYALSPGAGPVGITTGLNNSIWFTEFRTNKIGCITPEDEITEYEVPTPNSHPFSIAVGSDGAVWFTENASGKIGRLQVQATPSAAAQTTFSEDNQLTFVMVSVGGPGIPYFRPMIKGMEDACALLEAECHWLSDPSFGGFEAVTGYWEDALALNPDGIGTTAAGVSADPTSFVRAGVEQAAELGIPVIIVGAQDPDAGTDRALPTLFSIGPDEFSAGASNARRVIAEAEADGVTIHRGVCITHGIGISVFDERCAGVESVLSEEGVPVDVLEIVWDDPLATRDIIADYFADHPDANAIFSVSSQTASGLNLYLQQAGLQPRQLYATTHDTSEEILQMIRDGYLLQAYDQSPYMQGFQTIMSLYLASQFAVRPSSNIYTGTVIDQGNVDQVSELVVAGYR